MRDDQTVAEMVNEVLMRQAKARAHRSGEPIEEVMEAVLDTEAGKQLRELRDGPHGNEGLEEWQIGVAGESPGGGRIARQTSRRDLRAPHAQLRVELL